VTAQTQNGDYAGGAQTDVDGGYLIEDLAAGSYDLHFQPASTDNFIAEWYNDQKTQSAANAIVVKTGQTVAGRNVALDPGASISGTITNSSKANLSGINVTASTANYQYFYDSTDSKGKYTVNGLPAGSYSVSFYDYNGVYLGQSWNNKSSSATPDPIVVSAGQKLTGKNVTLIEGGTIKGTIRGPANVAAEGINISASTETGKYLGSATSDAKGNYTLSALAPGKVALEYSSGSGANYLSEWYNDKGSRDTADLISVKAGATVTAKTITLAVGASISGKVTNASGKNLGSISVSISSGSTYQSGGTDGDGNYSFAGLPAGSYTVSFYDFTNGYLSQYWLNKSDSETADKIVLATGQKVTGKNVVLVAGATIKGSIRGPSNNVIEGLSVTAYTDAGRYAGSTRTDAKGNYSLTGLRAGSFALQFQEYNSGIYLSEWYQDKTTRESANLIAVTAGQTVTASTAVLATGASVSGKVTNASKTGIANVSVRVGNSSRSANATTDANGNYEVAGLVAGTYSVYFSDPSKSYLDQYWKQGNDATSGAPVTLTTGQKVANTNVVLEAAAKIKGTVRNAANQAVSGISVIAYGDASFQASTISDASGNYEIPGLRAGKFALEFTSGGTSSYAGEWYENKSSRATATLIAVKSGQTIAAKAVVLAAGASISGTVTDSSKTKVSNIWVNVYGNKHYYSARTDAKGNYTVSGLPVGEYTVRFSDYSSNYLERSWDGPNGTQPTQLIKLTSGQKKTGISVTLSTGATILGSVRGPTGQSLSGVTVMATTATGTYLRAVTSDASGNYAVKGLPAGKVALRFVGDQSSGYITEWYDNKSTLQTATLLTVNGEQSLTAKPAVLAVGASISGNITNALKANLGNILVIAKRNNETYTGYTDNQGKYSVGSLPAGTYTLAFSDGSGKYLPQSWNNKTGAQSPTTVTVKAGEKSTGKNAILVVGATISGTVRGAGNQTLSDVAVNAYNSKGALLRMSFTDAQGNYSLPGLATGSVAIRISPIGLESYAPEWYNNKYTLATASLVAVKAGQSVTAKDVVLEAGGSISGKVTASAGFTSSNYVLAKQAGSQEGFADAVVNPDGTYKLSNLAPGSYKLVFSNFESQYVSQWFSGKATESTATPIVVAKGQNVTGKNITLVKGGSISGTVKNDAGKSLGSMSVPVWMLRDSKYEQVAQGYTDIDGGYSVPGLAAGTYKIGFGEYSTGISLSNSGTYSAEYWDNKPNLASASTIVVKPQQAVTKKNATLTAIANLKSFTGSATPTISGTPAVGSKLTGSVAALAPKPAVVELQWLRNGQAISKATGSSYTLVAADKGAKITFRVSGKSSGYKPSVKTSAATVSVTAGVVTGPTPAISGTTKVGNSLTVVAGKWGPAPVKLSYVWSRNGSAIAGATSSKYQLVAADKGKTITVKVTGKRSGYTGLSKTSAGKKIT